MKLQYLFFVGGVLLITIGLVDYYYLRGLEQVSMKEESQQLAPSIIGALILVISPLFDDTPISGEVHSLPKWFRYTITLFLVLTGLVLINTVLFKPYSNMGYAIRHTIGLILIIILTINCIKQGDASVK